MRSCPSSRCPLLNMLEEPVQQMYHTHIIWGFESMPVQHEDAGKSVDGGNVRLVMRRQIDARRLAIVLGVLLSALLLSSCLCFVVGYHRHNIRKAFHLPRQLSSSLKLPLHYEKHKDDQKSSS